MLLIRSPLREMTIIPLSSRMPAASGALQARSSQVPGIRSSRWPPRVTIPVLPSSASVRTRIPARAAAVAAERILPQEMSRLLPWPNSWRLRSQTPRSISSPVPSAAASIPLMVTSTLRTIPVRCMSMALPLRIWAMAPRTTRASNPWAWPRATISPSSATVVPTTARMR